MEKLVLLIKSPLLRRAVSASVCHGPQALNCVRNCSLATASLHSDILQTFPKSRHEAHIRSSFGCKPCRVMKHTACGLVHAHARNGNVSCVRSACCSQHMGNCLPATKRNFNTSTNIVNSIHGGASTHLTAAERKFYKLSNTRNSDPDKASLLHTSTHENANLLLCTNTDSSHKSSMYCPGKSFPLHLTWFICYKPNASCFSSRHSLHMFLQNLLQPTKSASRRPLFRPLHSRTLDDFTMENANYHEYLESLVSEYSDLSEMQQKGENVNHSHLMFLESVAVTVKELQSASAEVSELQDILSGNEDKELQALARVDMDNMQQHIRYLQEKLLDLLVGAEPADKNDIMLEVSAGVGGQEAMLFTAEIFDMYAGYADFKGWTFGVVEREKSDLGGLRRASALITGMDVYKHLKFEAGVHRVQRVPKTERSGRIHTSTMTVAVLPQPSQIDISVNPKDLHIDTFRAGGAGGQHVNKTESAVRITHKPSGTVAECQQDRSQIKNRELAMKILLSRLYQKQLEKQEATLRRKRKLQVGTAGRSEKIRTYNYSQDRITDHRGPVTLFGVSSFLSGEDDMEDLLQTLMLQSRLEILEDMVDQFVENRQKAK